MIKLDLQHFAQDELLGTWAFKEVITPLDTYNTFETRELVSFYTIRNTDNTKEEWNGIYMEQAPNTAFYLHYIYKTETASHTTSSYDYYNNSWFTKYFSIITITDVSKLTNRVAFSSWLNANATKITKTDVILTESSTSENEIYPVTRTDLLRNKEYATPFIAKTDEDKQIAKDENGNLWYKGGSGGGGSAYYNPNKVSLFGFTPDSSNNTFGLTGSTSNPLEVDWGDGTKETITSAVTHTYTEPFKDILVVVNGVITDFNVNKNINYSSLGENTISDLTFKFNNCPLLTTVSIFNSKTIGSMFGAFSNSSSLVEVSLLDTKNVTQLTTAFSGCSSLVTISPFNTSKVTTAASAFKKCSSLVTIPPLDTSNIKDMSYMFYECKQLATIPPLNTSKVTDMHDMFNGCSSLVTIPPMNVEKVTDMRFVLLSCYSLLEINMYNINADLFISHCTKMQQPALHKLIDNLMQQPDGTRRTLTLGATLLARVSEEYKQKANAKGWDLVE